jgi:hypothetical protein
MPKSECVANAMGDDMLNAIIKLQLEHNIKLGKENHCIPFIYDDDVVQLVLDRCSELKCATRYQAGVFNQNDGRGSYGDD